MTPPWPRCSTCSGAIAASTRPGPRSAAAPSCARALLDLLPAGPARDALDELCTTVVTRSA